MGELDGGVDAGGAGVGGAVGVGMGDGVPMTEYEVPVGSAVVSLDFLLVPSASEGMREVAAAASPLKV